MNISTKLIALIFAVALLFAGCSNPASNDDDHEEHTDPDTVEFLINGDVIVSYTYSSKTTEGQFNVNAGEQTPLITAEFKDENGNEIHAEDLDDEYSFIWNIANTEIAEVVQTDSDGRWQFHITGKAAGETTVQFTLDHNGHPDFQTPGTEQDDAITIQVTEPSQ
jgi:predicted nucleotidyltransferase